MLGGWSTTIDPIQLAEKGARLTGELPLSGMHRLVKMCADEQGSVSVDLHFERDLSDGLRLMRGRIDARIGVICQRCMERFEVGLTTEPQLILLRPGEHEHLVETGDALIIDQPVTLGELVEDELLLEVPMVPMHASDACPARSFVAADKPEQRETRANPFSALGKLKQSDR